MKQIRGPPETPLTIVYFKHSQICSPAFWLLPVIRSTLSSVQFHWLHLIIFIPVNPSDAIHALPLQRGKSATRNRKLRKAGTLLWHLVLSTSFTISLRLISKWADGIIRLVGVTVFWKALVMSFSTGHVFDLLASCRPIRECLRVERFIPRQTPASGARRNPVHHCRTYSFGARLCSNVLCYLAYFSSISNGPLPNWSSSCELMVDRGRREPCPHLSVRTVSRAREEGHQGQNDTLNRWQEPKCWPTVGWMISYRKKRGRIELPWPSDCLRQSQNKMRDKYCLDQWEEEIASTAKTRMWVLL